MTIRNVIFDVGNVLLEWNPPKFLQELQLPSHFNEIFESLLWATHDGGLLSRQELLEKIPSQYDKAIFSYCINKIAGELKPIPVMIDLFHQLRRQGYKVFILSNMPEELHQELVLLHDFFMHPDGSIFSYEIKAIKPQPQIYKALLEKYKIYPEESVFIDDRFDNIFAAEKLKFKTVHCQSPQEARAELERLLNLV